MTLLAFALLAGTFLYVAVIGSRVFETTRARVAADATAMAAATIKARVLNYTSFILLADAILLPLAELANDIKLAQGIVLTGCFLASIAVWSLLKTCVKYGKHVWKTKPGPVKNKVQDWLDGLEATAILLIRWGPHWAEFVAARTGTNAAYKDGGGGGVAIAASYPIPMLIPPVPGIDSRAPRKCEKLGLRMVSSNDSIGGGADACHGILGGGLEFLYLATSGNLLGIAGDTLGLMITGQALFAGGRCSNRVKVPTLTDDWKQYSVSRGMALSDERRDAYFKGRLESFMSAVAADTSRSSLLAPNYLLGMGCAEHYSPTGYANGQDSLWNMDFRARLVPCEYTKSENVDMVRECAVPGPGNLGAEFMGGGPTLKLALIIQQFQRQLNLNIAEHWRY